MKPTDPSLERLREAWASMADGARLTEDCPSPETLWATTCGQLTPAEIREIWLHATGCPACTEAWRLARDIAAGASAVPSAPSPERARRRPFIPWLTWGGLAAAATLLLFVVLFQLRGTREELVPPGFRTPDQEPIHSLVNGMTLPRDLCVLRWAGPEGASYEINVATEDLRTLVEARDLVVGEFQVPADVLESLPGGAKLLWQVKATLPGGQRLASRTFVSILE